MNDSKIAVLIEEIEQGLAVLQKNESFLTSFLAKEYASWGQGEIAAIVIADTITNYYTCTETIFLRISRFFENSLQTDKWHSDLLHKMTLSIKPVRPAVISDQTYSAMLELMRFRHFKRYYFDFDYDWDRLEFLLKKYHQTRPLLRKDLEKFVEYLRDL